MFSWTYDMKEGAWALAYKAADDGLTEILGVNASGDLILLVYFLVRPLLTKLYRFWVICHNPIFPISPVTFSVWFSTAWDFSEPYRWHSSRYFSYFFCPWTLLSILCFLMPPISLYFSDPSASPIPWCLSQLRFCHGLCVNHFPPLSGQSLVMTMPLGGEGIKWSDGTLWSRQIALTPPLSFCREHWSQERVCEDNCSCGNCWLWILPSLGHIYRRPTLASPTRTPSRSPSLL